VIEASVFGDAIHVLVTSATRGLDELPAYLARKDLAPRSIARIPASLEDVFVRLIADDGAKRERAA
jgi:hypothetical protein